jgi:hypothetical protein
MLGFALAAALLGSRPAGAQFTGTPRIASPLPASAAPTPPASPVVMPQPIEVQGLDGTHFVVATREPRLVRPAAGEGSPAQMLVTVVTHYTVAGDRLLPLEHVRTPAGWVPVLRAGD